MKKLLLASLLLLTTAFIAVSCGENGPEEEAVQLSVNYTQGDIPTAGGTATFTITCNAGWTISNPNAWLTLGNNSGNGNSTITVTVAANTGVARQGTITVTAGDKTGTVVINQLGEGTEVTLSVSYTPNDVPTAGGTETFTITCNADWTISNPNAWLTLDNASGNGNSTITVTVAANTGVARQGTITVTAGDKTETVVINQLGEGTEVTLSVSYTPNDVPAAGGTETFTITCNADWTISNPNTWLTLDNASGNGNSTITVTVAANTGVARQGTITVTAGDKTETVVINQLEYTTGDSNIVYDTGTTMEELFAAFEQCTLIDKDGDGFNWVDIEFEDDEGVLTGDYGIVSHSWLRTALTPENYLILPAQTIKTGARFTVNLYASDPDYYLEKFKLIISDQPITEDNCRDAEVIYDGILTTPDRTDYVGVIPESYNNGTVYLGICHYNTTDEFSIVIQSMRLTHEGAPSNAAPASIKTGKTGHYAPAYRPK